MSLNVLLLCIRVVRGGSTWFNAVEPPRTRAQPADTPGGGAVGEGSVRSNLPELVHNGLAGSALVVQGGSTWFDAVESPRVSTHSAETNHPELE